MRIIPILLLLFTGLGLLAQKPVQTVRGYIYDQQSQQPLIGASIYVVDSDPAIGTASDVEGRFELPQVAVGRQVFEVTYTGYETYRSEGVLINRAKSPFLEIGMTESATQLDEVIVKAYTPTHKPVNEAALVSTRSFNVEETQRYAASANDPSRMAMGLPGVQASRDTRSDIIIRGNSSVGLLWRLEGMDIPNPNHFARRGTSGGGITIFSISMLSQSDFSVGAFPAEYGNALSGVFDIRFRPGNKEERENTIRVGLLGLDFSTEGPLKKGRSSYLVNYRYSTLGILNDLGFPLVGERFDNTFQDLSFKLHFVSKNAKTRHSIWGISGLSEEVKSPEDPTPDDPSFEELSGHDFKTRMGAIGYKLNHLLDERSALTINVAAMGQEINWKDQTLFDRTTLFNFNQEDYTNNRLSIAANLDSKWTASLSSQFGLQASQLFYDLTYDSLNLVNDQQRLIINQSGNTTLVQPYTQWFFRPDERWTFSGGLHLLYFALNESLALDPRLAIKYLISPKQSLSLAYGLHSRILPIGTYFTRFQGREELLLANKNLDLMRAHHLVLSYEQSLAKRLRLHVEAYYQALFQIPVRIDRNSSYWMLNDIQGYATQQLESEGLGRNIGLDMSIEQTFEQGTFFLISGSIFESTYQTREGAERYSTQYNSRFSATFIGGKEWINEKGNSWQLGLKALYNGGLPYTPVVITGTEQDFYFPIRDEQNPFSARVSAYFRPDLRLAYRHNARKTAWWIALDVQNFINRRNEDALSREYNALEGTWDDLRQSGLTPIISFQLDW